MWMIDHPSMILLIVGGIDLGVKGAFGIDLGGRYLGGYTNAAYILVGISALWQLKGNAFPYRRYRGVAGGGVE
jgi:uncharacterized membrane protein YuzA (DUF378 family)